MWEHLPTDVSLKVGSFIASSKEVMIIFVRASQIKYIIINFGWIACEVHYEAIVVSEILLHCFIARKVVLNY